jgi:hypothetical protein
MTSIGNGATCQQTHSSQLCVIFLMLAMVIFFEKKKHLAMHQRAHLKKVCHMVAM